MLLFLLLLWLLLLEDVDDECFRMAVWKINGRVNVTDTSQYSFDMKMSNKMVREEDGNWKLKFMKEQ